MKRSILILFALTLLGTAFSQEPEKENKNSLYCTLGIGFFNSVNISYERKIWEPGLNLINEFWIRENIGAGYLLFNGNGVSSTTSIQILSAGDVLRWDFGLGFSYFYIPGTVSPSTFLPAANFGIRLQWNHRSPVLRLGTSFPEYLYLGFGYEF